MRRVHSDAPTHSGKPSRRRVPAWLFRLGLAAGMLLATGAQADSVESMAGNWSTLTLSGNFGDFSPRLQEFRWFLMNQTRLRDDNPDAWRLSEDLLRFQLGYDLNSYASVWLGYVNEWHHSLGKAAFQESRPYAALQFDFPIAGFKAQVRTRIEQRINRVTGNVGVRLRQALKLRLPLEFIDPKLSLYLGDEVFGYLNTNTFGPTGFSENRAMAGFGLKLTRRLSVDLGYLGQTIQKISGDVTLTHNVYANVSYRF
ncbi:DUF2490 domain-containing protein [Methylocaldum sp. MU1018]